MCQPGWLRYFLFSVPLVQKHSQNLCAGLGFSCGAKTIIVWPLRSSMFESELTGAGRRGSRRGEDNDFLVLFVSWRQHWTLIRQLFFSLHDQFFLPPFLQVSVCLSVHSTYQHQGASTEGLEVNMFHCIQNVVEEFSMLFLYLSDVQDLIFSKEKNNKKQKVSSTCNTNNRFYCIYVERVTF